MNRIFEGMRSGSMLRNTLLTLMLREMETAIYVSEPEVEKRNKNKNPEIGSTAKQARRNQLKSGKR